MDGPADAAGGALVLGGGSRGRAGPVRGGARRRRPHRHAAQAPVPPVRPRVGRVGAGDLASAEALVAGGSRRRGTRGHVRAAAAVSALAVDGSAGTRGAGTAAARQRLEGAEAKSELPGIVRGRTVLGLLALSEGDTRPRRGELAEAARLLGEMGYRHPGAFPVLPDAIEALARARRRRRGGAVAWLEREARAVASPWALAALERARGTVAFATRRSGEAAATSIRGRSVRRARLRPGCSARATF